jgi:hypothetical protein
VFNTVGKLGWADQVLRRRAMQTNPEQPIEAGEVVHVGMGYKGMSNAQKLARAASNHRNRRAGRGVQTESR